MCHNVLIIARSQEARQALSDKLNADYHLFTANEWIDSILLIKRRPIQLIICITDDQPASAFLLCRQLKSNGIAAHIPVILITARENLQVRIKSLEAGADVHIGGPVFREYLDVQMRNLIANRVKVRQHFARATGIDDHQPELTGKEEIIKKLNNCLFALKPDTEMGVDQLARLMHMSLPTLYRKIKDITHLTPNELINEARLRKAADLLTEGRHRVSEVARMVGYGSPSSFGKSFLKQFKVTPATYQRMKKIMDAA
jgi:two-component system cell cycle response regulator